jgi:hypothetical protein
MDWKTFTVQLLGSVTWPAVLLVIAWLFRQPIRGFLENMETFKGGISGVEASRRFSQALNENEILQATAVSTEVTSVATGSVIESRSHTEETDVLAGSWLDRRTVGGQMPYWRVTEENARECVLKAFGNLTDALRDRFGPVGLELLGMGEDEIDKSPLAQKGLLTNDQLSVFLNLRSLFRDVSRHREFAVDRGEAFRYVLQTAMLIHQIRTGSRTGGPPGPEDVEG